MLGKDDVFKTVHLQCLPPLALRNQAQADVLRALATMAAVGGEDNIQAAGLDPINTWSTQHTLADVTKDLRVGILVKYFFTASLPGLLNDPIVAPTHKTPAKGDVSTKAQFPLKSPASKKHKK